MRGGEKKDSTPIRSEHKRNITVDEMINEEAIGMAVNVEYPCFGSGEPTRLSADAIRRLGADLRQRLLGYNARPFEPANLFRRAACLRVNGRPLRIVWDAAHAVHDEAGEPVLGVCEHDPQEPATVMISLNGELLGNQPDMLGRRPRTSLATQSSTCRRRWRRARRAPSAAARLRRGTPRRSIGANGAPTSSWARFWRRGGSWRERSPARLPRSARRSDGR